MIDKELEENMEDADIVILDDSEANELITEDTISSDKNPFIVPGYGKCEVVVHTSREGDHNPHFHIITTVRAKRSNKYKEICVMLNEPVYFNHENHHEPFENSAQTEYLNKWCSENNKKNIGFTNWQCLCMAWNKCSTHVQVPYNGKDVKQPDYSLLR